MIEKFDKINPLGIKVPYSINIKKNDTIVFEVDLESEQIDIEYCQQFIKIVSDLFPNNQVLLTPKGIEVKGVIKNE